MKRIKKSDKIDVIIRHLKGRRVSSPPEPITLCQILAYLKVKFRLEELTPRELFLVGAWRYNANDLRRQFTPCIDFILYLVLTPSPYGSRKHIKKVEEVREADDQEPSESDRVRDGDSVASQAKA